MSSILYQSTENPFAILLFVYMNSKRSKLENSSSLTNIAAKFAKKSEKLLKLFKKNNEYIKVPEKVSILEVQRVIYNYSIPDEYLQLLPHEITNESSNNDIYDNKNINYDIELDPRMKSFNVDKCIEQKLLHLATTSTCAPLDNLAMSKPLLPGAFQPTTKPLGSSSRLSSSSSSSSSLSMSRNESIEVVKKKANEKEEEKERKPLPYNPGNILDEMAWRASRRGPEAKKRLPEGQNGPYEQLRQWMLKKQRINAVIRDNYGIRGSVVGELVAFDHHMNIALRNATEHYRLPSQHFPLSSTSYKATSEYHEDDDEEEQDEEEQEEQEQQEQQEEIEQLGDRVSDVPRGEVMSRDLPRILIRGDTVVSINCPDACTSSLAEK